MSQVAKVQSDASTDTPDIALLDAITDAFNRNSTEEVMAFFAEDSSFDTTAGPDVDGKNFVGKAAIAAAFDGLFNSVQVVHWEPLDTRVVGDKAYCEFRRTATLANGDTQDYLSIDVITFRAGKIVRKSSYAKRRG